MSVAEKDPRIRAAILNGSRANVRVPKDALQDFDVIFIVNDLASFRAEPEWINAFGERIMMQMPNAMDLGPEAAFLPHKDEITYLMLFSDHNRIDLTLMHLDDIKTWHDSLSKILMDKDNLLHLPEPSDRDYLVSKPGQKEFADCCNEFWWVSTYVVKGLIRNEVLYAREMLEIPMRKMFMRMLAWYVGTESNFSVNLGSSYHFLKNHVSPEVWKKVLKTYPTIDAISIQKSFHAMTAFFQELAPLVAHRLKLNYNQREARNVLNYLQAITQRSMS